MIKSWATENDVIDPRDKAPEALHSLTLSPRGVLIARVPDHTPDNIMEITRSYLKECFPNNKVVVIWNTIDLSVIEDNSWIERMTPEHDTQNYY
jgi:hypothetical protein